MTKNHVKEILDRVLAWPADDQERLARFVEAVEERQAGIDISDEEWGLIEARATRRDLASEGDVEAVLGRYRHA
jgi:hypothetical protein